MLVDTVDDADAGTTTSAPVSSIWRCTAPAPSAVPLSVRTHSVRDATYFAPSNANVQLISAHSCPNALASHETSAPSSPTARTCVACAAVAALCVNAASRTCVLSAGPPGAVISAGGFAVSTGAVPGGP